MNNKLTDERIASLVCGSDGSGNFAHCDYADIACALRELQERRKAAQQPYAYLRENDGQIQISIGPERPHDRSGGYATPWAAIYAAPQPLNDAERAELQVRRRADNAEPVAWDYEWASCITCEGPQNFKRVIEREAPPEWAVDDGQAKNITLLYAAPPAPVVPNGWIAVPIEPTEDMIIAGFESAPNEDFSEPEEWEAYAAMSGCQQAAHKARLCWAAMLAAAPEPTASK